MQGRHYLVTGGAGFVGSNVVERLLTRSASRVTVFDNFASGRREFLEPMLDGGRLTVIEGDARDLTALTKAMDGHDAVYHMAANSDIAKATTQPAIDFDNGTVLTHNVLEAMRVVGAKRITFPSGSGVYGEVPPIPLPENYPEMRPVSTYGACKLASEALISAYSFMFGFTGTVCRLANVVGPRQTHGVSYDFVRRLRHDPSRLRILGNGTQSKPYIHIDDVLDAFDLMEQTQQGGYECVNVGSADALTVREIAEIAMDQLHLQEVEFDFTGGERGWKGDVPLYRLDTTRLRNRGWTPKWTSRQAVTKAVQSVMSEWPS